MDPSNAQHNQDMANETLESMLVCTKSQQEMKKPRPQQEQALRCPRCDSTNTKFCYYNNYSLTQPRYFCKSCRRYWTKGGTLRNVPVGGGCRKTKRSSSKRNQDQPLITNNQMINPVSNLPSLTYDTNDLSLAFARLQKQPNGVLGFHHDHHDQIPMLSNPSDTHFDLLGNPSGQIIGGHRNGGFLDGFYNSNSNNMFNGYGMGMENLGTNGNGGDQEMGVVPNFEDLNVNVNVHHQVKQEYCNGGRDGSDNRVLFGFPWQIGGGDHGNMSGGGGGYNGSSMGGSTNWHGLINSPLM